MTTLPERLFVFTVKTPPGPMTRWSMLAPRSPTGMSLRTCQPFGRPPKTHAAKRAPLAPLRHALVRALTQDGRADEREWVRAAMFAQFHLPPLLLLIHVRRYRPE